MIKELGKAQSIFMLERHPFLFTLLNLTFSPYTYLFVLFPCNKRKKEKKDEETKRKSWNFVMKEALHELDQCQEHIARASTWKRSIWKSSTWKCSTWKISLVPL